MATINSYRFYSDEDELAEFWREVIEKKREIHIKNSEMILPPVIRDETDFKAICFEMSRPNFIGKQSVEGEVVNFEMSESADIEDKIVLIEKVDPGFDWIFTKNIKGLITKYGGAASHMAIRCAEFNIAAAIGCGEQIYAKIRRWEKLKLDCKAKKILPAVTQGQVGHWFDQ
jgi:phosphohistidine swiveling domain-containing protein